MSGQISGANFKKGKLMEIGNAVFGNSRGEYPIDRNQMRNIPEWDDLMIFFDCMGHATYDGYLGEKYSMPNAGFKNDVFQLMPYYWGDCEDIKGHNEDGDCSKCKVTDDCLLLRDNFIYFPDDLHIQWYKYPFRDAYSNKPISSKNFRKAIKHCIQSLPKRDVIWERNSPINSDFQPLDTLKFLYLCPNGHQIDTFANQDEGISYIKSFFIEKEGTGLIRYINPARNKIDVISKDNVKWIGFSGLVPLTFVEGQWKANQKIPMNLIYQ